MLSRGLRLSASERMLCCWSECKNLIIYVAPSRLVSLEPSELESLGLNWNHWVSQKSRSGIHVSALFAIQHLGNTNTHEHMHAGWMKYAIRLHLHGRELEIAKSLQPNDSLFPVFVFTATCLYTGEIPPANPSPCDPIKPSEMGKLSLSSLE